MFEKKTAPPPAPLPFPSSEVIDSQSVSCSLLKKCPGMTAAVDWALKTNYLDLSFA